MKERSSNMSLKMTLYVSGMEAIVFSVLQNTFSNIERLINKKPPEIKLVAYCKSVKGSLNVFVEENSKC